MLTRALKFTGLIHFDGLVEKHRQRWIGRLRVYWMTKLTVSIYAYSPNRTKTSAKYGRAVRNTLQFVLPARPGYTNFTVALVPQG